jgi:hypothetical protein
MSTARIALNLALLPFVASSAVLAWGGSVRLVLALLLGAAWLIGLALEKHLNAHKRNGDGEQVG